MISDIRNGTGPFNEEHKKKKKSEKKH